MERIKHVQPRTRVASARAAGNAGIDLLRIYNMQNTNDFINSENTERFKLQAASVKRQAPSSKHQASSAKLKKYYRKNPEPRSTNRP